MLVRIDSLREKKTHGSHFAKQRVHISELEVSAMRTSDDSEALIGEQPTQARDVEELRNGKHSAIAPLAHG